MTQQCDICQGSKTIHLPVDRPLSSPMRARDAWRPEIEESSRTFDCPQCVGVPDNKLHVVCGAETVDTRDIERYEGALQIVRENAARNIIGYLLRHNMFRFEQKQGAFNRTEIIASLAVVEPDRITSLEQRVQEATGPALDRLAKRIADKISIWGRDIGRSTIAKDEAVRFVNEGLREERLK